MCLSFKFVRNRKWRRSALVWVDHAMYEWWLKKMNRRTLTRSVIATCSHTHTHTLLCDSRMSVVLESTRSNMRLTRLVFIVNRTHCIDRMDWISITMSGWPRHQSKAKTTSASMAHDFAICIVCVYVYVCKPSSWSVWSIPITSFNAISLSIQFMFQVNERTSLCHVSLSRSHSPSINFLQVSSTYTSHSTDNYDSHICPSTKLIGLLYIAHWVTNRSIDFLFIYFPLHSIYLYMLIMAATARRILAIIS